MSILDNDNETENKQFLRLKEFIKTGDETTADAGKIGKLQSEIRGKIHTKQAAKLITGAEIQAPNENNSEKKHKAIGLYNFSLKGKILEEAIRKDDPYADYFFYQLHQLITKERELVKAQTLSFATWLNDEIPPALKVSEALNQLPYEAEFKFNSALAFQMLYLILELDEYFRLIMLAQHVSLMDSKQGNRTIYECMRNARRIMTQINPYKYTEVTRRDFEDNNQRAKKAIESMRFELDPNFISGELRSAIAPPIPTRPEKASKLTEEKNAQVA